MLSVKVDYLERHLTQRKKWYSTVFLSSHLKFTDMANVVSEIMDQLLKGDLLNNSLDIESVVEIDNYARSLAQKNKKICD